MATRKTRRMQMLIFGAVLLAAAAGLVSFAFRDTIVFFFSPTELMAEARRPDQLLRVGGLVVADSIQRGQGETVSFDVTDGNGTLTVAFTGVLPDLFREGQGVVAEGYLRNGRFEAVEVLAKHDENYMPKEVADALKEQGHWQDGEPAATGTGGS
ncbi:cytochrome c maturation protein CcmE [Thermohalobaculum xanthum]|nr:cytochrome c maturation protein CcmE [Thermohalobaculum xanthum]